MDFGDKNQDQLSKEEKVVSLMKSVVGSADLIKKQLKDINSTLNDIGSKDKLTYHGKNNLKIIEDRVNMLKEQNKYDDIINELEGVLKAQNKTIEDNIMVLEEINTVCNK